MLTFATKTLGELYNFAVSRGIGITLYANDFPSHTITNNDLLTEAISKHFLSIQTHPQTLRDYPHNTPDNISRVAAIVGLLSEIDLDPERPWYPSHFSMIAEDHPTAPKASIYVTIVYPADEAELCPAATIADSDRDSDHE